ncbi:hypothetical protein HanRHA438_Chr17g0793421 [Helianthus annuus]|nr:hypothetical protein HanRHA438_Chr17g0793421 [Helianthus annuus]
MEMEPENKIKDQIGSENWKTMKGLQFTNTSSIKLEGLFRTFAPIIKRSKLKKKKKKKRVDARYP